jgi:Domain of unknown function (DUF4381)
MPASDPAKLTQALPLRDLHLPPAPGWWPPAIGWWLLVGLLLILALLLLLGWQRSLRLRYRRQALRRLTDLEQDSLPVHSLLAELSQLLRRAALCAFPEDNGAGLNGEEWLRFLELRLKQSPFTTGVGRCLASGPYQPAVEIDRDALLSLCRRWLRRLPPAPRRRRAR